MGAGVLTGRRPIISQVSKKPFFPLLSRQSFALKISNCEPEGNEKQINRAARTHRRCIRTARLIS